jgi:vacuolar protein sorting-associated protein 13A/C
VDKSAVHWVQLKRNQQYNEEDYRQLESLMYDKLFLHLEDAQVTSIFLPMISKINNFYF